jgi:small subunit ribosomal protein S9
MVVKEKKKGIQYDAWAIGRRKTSVARVYVLNGSGKIIINKRDIRDYFSKATSRYIVNQPLSLLKKNDQYDFKINVTGGGTTGQAGAIRLGISRALIKLSSSFREPLKKAGFITRDSRKVERQKPGMRGARANYQFSKR